MTANLAEYLAGNSAGHIDPANGIRALSIDALERSHV